MNKNRHVLVTGATGYIGGRLIPMLLKKRIHVRVLVRNPDRLEGRAWSRHVDVIQGDMQDEKIIRHALESMDAAYYFIHSMYAGGDFEKRDRDLALRFARVAQQVNHIIYLGGLQPQARKISKHLRSRAEVGEILRSHCSTTEFRAGPIIGAGSASFEMNRYLTERLPVMITPRWIFNPVQTLAIGDLLAYLTAALDHPPLGIVEIGSTPVSFKQMMLTYARIRGLKRLIIPTPLLAPWLAGHWVGLITPIPNTIARPLINGVISPVLGDTGKAGDTFPNIHPMSYEAAVRLALSECHDNCIETRWCDSGGHRPDYEVVDKEGMIREMRSLYTPASPDHVYRIVSSLGGDRGWLKWSWAWGLRGLLDRIAGGPGLRRGRRHVTEVRTGDAVDFWRVERVVSPHLLRLRAEMRLPGDAWMQWEIRSEAQGTILIQTALFKPLGLAGLLYWYILLPIHKRIFRDLARAIIREAETHIESL